MATAALRLGPADHGRRLTLEEFEAADYAPGFRYELIDGRLYVSPEANFPESFLETWLRRAVERYADAHPEVVGYVAVKGRVFLPRRSRPTAAEPDVAVYPPFDLARPLRQIDWRQLSPVLVAEVLVDGDFDKDLTRNPRLYLSVPAVREYWVVNGAEDPDEPSVLRHRRRGRRWEVTTVPFGGTLTTDVLPGFTLVVDPRR